MREHIPALPLAAGIVCVVIFAACGPDGSDPTQARPESPQEPEVVFVEYNYRFFDEIAALHPQFEPRAMSGLATRAILAFPPLADSDGDASEQLEWAPLPPEYRSRRIRIPDVARLEFAVLFPGAPAVKDFVPTYLELVLETEEETRQVFEQLLDPREKRHLNGPLELRVDLTHYAGVTARFVFRTEARPVPGATEDGMMAVWADPILVNVAAKASVDKPNVVFICLDTLRADHLGCYGYDRPTSPNIDAFAAESLLFENAFASSSWTLASHASLFTGTAPSTHGATFQPSDGPLPRIDRSFTMFAEIARANDYRTAAFTEGGYVHPIYGFDQGFEQYTTGALRLAESGADARGTFRAATNWMRSVRDQPFFLFVHTYQVHIPYSPSPEYLQRFPTEPESQFPEGFNIFPRRRAKNLTPADKRQIVTLYDAEIAFADDVVFAFLNSLKAIGHWEDTLIVLFSDHGEEFWEHGDMTHGLTLHTEVVRVPLMIKLPGANPRTGRIGNLVSLVDVYATVCDAMGWEYDTSLDTRSFHDLLRAEEGFKGRDFVFSELGYRPDIWSPLKADPRTIAVRSLDELYLSVRGTENEEFYILADDPGELHDRSGDFPVRSETMRARVRDYSSAAVAKRESIRLSDPVMTELGEQHKDQLRALGYLE